MMKGLAEPLAELHERLLRARAEKGLRTSLWTSAQSMMSLRIMNVVEHDGPIVRAAEAFSGAIVAFTGGSDVSAGTLRSPGDDRVAFDRALAALVQLKDALRDARYSEVASIIHIDLDQTQVPDPF